MTRSLEELRATDDPALPLLEEWAEAATVAVEILPPADRSGAALLALQVTRRSLLGALADDTGGVLVDHGWLRHLGGGSPRLPRDLAGWNKIGATPVRLPGAMVVADDVLGGVFAINGGRFAGQPGHVWYFAPDRLDWEDLEIGHTAFVEWTMSGRLAQFYENERWPGWEAEVATIPGDRALSVYPFLGSDGGPIGERARKPVPVEQLWSLLISDGGRSAP